jgi:hypothetical protein
VVYSLGDRAIVRLEKEISKCNCRIHRLNYAWGISKILLLSALTVLVNYLVVVVVVGV